MTVNECIYPGPAVVHEVVDTVTASLLNARAVMLPQPPSDPKAGHEEWWTGWITVDGLASSGVMITCSKDFVQKAAMTMLQEPAPISDDVAKDVLGELTNVVGGNLKSLIPPPPDHVSKLSLPIVWSGTREVPKGVVVREQWYQCDGDFIQVKVVDFDGGKPEVGP